MAATSNLVPFSVDGKRAIVTGAGSGINLSFATLLLSKNCSVLFADISLRSEAQQVLDQYAEKKDGKARAVFQYTDVREWAHLERMFEAAERELGGNVDIVCPGAGIYDPHWTNFWHPPGTAKSKDAPDSNRYATVDINITHPIRTSQLAITRFLNPSSPSDKVSPSNPKRILIISSIGGQLSNLNTPIYVAAKHAMNGFIRSFAENTEFERRTGIRVNGVAPGVIKTPLWTDHPEKMGFLDVKEDGGKGRDEWVEPEEVAGAMVRCLEEEDLASGTILEVGKGQTRKVEALNDPGPSGPGHTAANMKQSYEEVYGWLGEGAWGVKKA